MQQKGLPWGYILPAIAVLVVILLLVYLNVYRPASGLKLIYIATQTPSSLADVPYFCDQPTGCAYHWHVHLDVFVGNSSFVEIPPDLGHVGNTLYAIHTHDSSGIIHLETPNNVAFTCGQLCEVWRYSSCNSTNCLTYHNEEIRAYVNGTLWAGAPSSIPLQQHYEIALVIGSPVPTNIPSSYAFPAGD